MISGSFFIFPKEMFQIILKKLHITSILLFFPFSVKKKKKSIQWTQVHWNPNLSTSCVFSLVWALRILLNSLVQNKASKNAQRKVKMY